MWEHRQARFQGVFGLAGVKFFGLQGLGFLQGQIDRDSAIAEQPAAVRQASPNPPPYPEPSSNGPPSYVALVILVLFTSTGTK